MFKQNLLAKFICLILLGVIGFFAFDLYKEHNNSTSLALGTQTPGPVSVSANTADGSQLSLGQDGDVAPPPIKDADLTAPVTWEEPTATTVPTPVIVPTTFDQIGEISALLQTGGITQSPLDCPLRVADVDQVAQTTGTIPIQCLDSATPPTVRPVHSGRIVAIVNEVARTPDLSAGYYKDQWSWTTQSLLGPHVVISHGPTGSHWGYETVYANLSQINPDLKLGTLIDTDTVLGQLADETQPLRFSVWADNERQDGATYPAQAPGYDRQLEVATVLSELVVSPTAPGCPLTFQHGLLPGAARTYRNGVHRGIDFMCSGPGVDAYAALDGQVVYLVNDYDDASPQDRNAVLAMAGRAKQTPHWILGMLYGNVVVIDHGYIEGVGRVTTVAAHLETVDPAVQLGAQIKAGDRLGEQGGRGTNASAEGRRGTADPGLHLHWEFYIDNWFLGQELPASNVVEILNVFMCSKANVEGCY